MIWPKNRINGIYRIICHKFAQINNVAFFRPKKNKCHSGFARIFTVLIQSSTDWLIGYEYTWNQRGKVYKNIFVARQTLIQYSKCFGRIHIIACIESTRLHIRLFSIYIQVYHKISYWIEFSVWISWDFALSLNASGLSNFCLHAELLINHFHIQNGFADISSHW